ncbi:MAG: hypothetical protein KA515_01475 [Candidatus Pacebacteria bacterium]|nr:hypothetical protein [Candidatus Paceibacterota bacterium]
MSSNIRNTIIFLGILMIFTGIYVFFFRDSGPTANLTVSKGAGPVTVDTNTANTQQTILAQKFLSLLLNVKNTKLDVSIFSDNAFLGLVDATTPLPADGNEGRANPFAPFGSEAASNLTTNSLSGVSTNPQ